MTLQRALSRKPARWPVDGDRLLARQSRKQVDVVGSQVVERREPCGRMIVVASSEVLAQPRVRAGKEVEVWEVPKDSTAPAQQQGDTWLAP